MTHSPIKIYLLKRQKWRILLIQKDAYGSVGPYKPRTSEFTINLRLISSPFHDLERILPSWQRRVTISAAIILVILNVCVVAFSRAYAGFFLSARAFSSIAGSLQADDINSQNMPILEAPLNTDLAGSVSATVTFAPRPLLADSGTAFIPGSVSTSSSATDASSSVSSDQSSSTLDSNAITIYTVVSGDSIGSIANKFDISVNTILWANDLTKKSIIKTGDKLVILPISGVEYTVKSGDTLLSIAKKFNGDPNDILSFNGMADGDKIVIGQKLIIPDGEMTVSSPTPSSTSGGQSSSSPSASHSLVTNQAGMEMSPDGYYMRPIKGGERTQGIHGNNAVDLAESCGSPIYASAAGTVLVSKDSDSWDGGYGNYVVISHSNNSQTLYAHMKTGSISVTLGDTVEQGEQIGSIGNTGDVTGVTGCHVHFEIRNGEKNPF